MQRSVKPGHCTVLWATLSFDGCIHSRNYQCNFQQLLAPFFPRHLKFELHLNICININEQLESQKLSPCRNLQRLVLGQLLEVKDLPGLADRLREQMEHCEIVVREAVPSQVRDLRVLLMRVGRTSNSLLFDRWQPVTKKCPDSFNPSVLKAICFGDF